MATVNYLKTMQGNDVPMATIQIVDAAQTPIPVDELNDYKINIYRLSDYGSKTLVYVLRKTPKVGNGDIVIVDNDAGKIGFIVPRSITKKCPAGLLCVEVEVQLNDTDDYENSILKVGGDNFILTQIVESSDIVTEI